MKLNLHSRFIVGGVIFSYSRDVDLMSMITSFILKLSNKKVIVDDCEYKSLYDTHNHFMSNLRLTDKQLAEMLETILFLKVVAVNLESTLKHHVDKI